MAKTIKRTFILLAMFSLVFIYAKAETPEEYVDRDFYQNYSFIEDAKLVSSLYTRVEDMSLVDEELYVDIDPINDVLVTENSNFQLYFNEDNLGFKILNKETLYVWSTTIEDVSAGSYDGLLSSGIGIEYINVQKDMFVEQNVGVSDTIFILEKENIADGISLSINVGGYCTTRNCERFYPDYLDEKYTKEEMVGFGLTEINIGFDLEVVLTETGINAYVPFESIVENNSEETILSSIILFPSLGATKMDEIPGYMIIPDGAGTLIRYEDNESKFITPFEEKFYGANFGLNTLTESVTSYPLSMPIFGAVHGVDQNAFIGIINEGDFSSRLFAYPNGAHNLDYNLIFPKFDFKETYRQSFSSDGTGGAMRYIESSTSDIDVTYNFLDGDNSNYVGIANNYSEVLFDEGRLTDLVISDPDIPINLEYFMSDSKSSFIGTSVIELSTVSNVSKMYNYFLDNGVTNQSVVLRGWNDGGDSGHLPSDLDFENKLGSNGDFRDLIDYINQENSVSLSNTYVFASSATSNISYRNDVAKGSNKFKMEMERNGVYDELYVLYPYASNSLAIDEYSSFMDEDVNLKFNSIGNSLFSYYDGDYYVREDSYNEYLEIMEKYEGSSTYAYPFAYAYEFTDEFYGTPLYNSQLKYYDDLVPVLQIVLSGHMSLYSNYLNFNSIGREQVLNIIDFNMYPSYVLTYEPSSNLKDTDNQRFFTTEFDLWKNTIVNEYEYINNALKYVAGESIVSRNVLDIGIVEINYSNDVSIYINYSTTDYTYNDMVVPAMNYYVGGVN